jgi:hypothetical protein
MDDQASNLHRAFLAVALDPVDLARLPKADGGSVVTEPRRVNA